MHAYSTDDICTHATRMLYTITMEMKLFLVPLFYCPCHNSYNRDLSGAYELRLSMKINTRETPHENQIGSANPKIGSASPNLKKGPLVRIKNLTR